MMYLGFSGFLALLIITLGVINLFLYTRLLKSLEKLKKQSSDLFVLLREDNALIAREKMIGQTDQNNSL